MPPVIEVRNLHKRYGDTVAVDDVSFTVDKGEILEDLLRAVRAAARGETTLSPSVAAWLMNRVRTPVVVPVLSPRELEVLELVAAGHNNRQAATRLFITEATIKSHLLNIYDKLGVRDRAAAVAEAFRRGLLKT